MPNHKLCVSSLTTHIEMAAPKKNIPKHVIRHHFDELADTLAVSSDRLSSVAERFYQCSIITLSSQTVVNKNGDLAGAHCLLFLLQLKVETSPEHIASVMNVLRGEESLRDIVSKMDNYLANE